jgi:hypothetical protein
MNGQPIVPPQDDHSIFRIQDLAARETQIAKVLNYRLLWRRCPRNEKRSASATQFPIQNLKDKFSELCFYDLGLCWVAFRRWASAEVRDSGLAIAQNYFIPSRMVG